MARKDIMIDIENGGFIVDNKNQQKETFPIIYIQKREEGMLERNLYFEVNVGNKSIYNEDLYFSLPYFPKQRNGFVRLIQTDALGNSSYVRNKINNSVWFEITENGNNISVSELSLISNIGRFTVRYNETTGSIDFFNMDEVDFAIGESAYQDALFLIRANKGGLYRYPSAGVGIFKYVHSSNMSEQLGKSIKDELLDDGIMVNEASINDDGDINLDFTELNKGYEEGQ